MSPGWDSLTFALRGGKGRVYLCWWCHSEGPTTAFNMLGSGCGVHSTKPAENSQPPFAQLAQQLALPFSIFAPRPLPVLAGVDPRRQGT